MLNPKGINQYTRIGSPKAGPKATRLSGDVKVRQKIKILKNKMKTLTGATRLETTSKVSNEIRHLKKILSGKG